MGGFKAAYGPDWTANKSHPDFIRDDVKAMGGDMDDPRCSGPRTRIARRPANRRICGRPCFGATSRLERGSAALRS